MIVVHEYPKVKMFCINYEQRQHVPLQLHIEAKQITETINTDICVKLRGTFAKSLDCFGKILLSLLFFW